MFTRHTKQTNFLWDLYFSHGSCSVKKEVKGTKINIIFAGFYQDNDDDDDNGLIWSNFHSNFLQETWAFEKHSTTFMKSSGRC